MTETTGTWPIVYRKEYNVKFFGIENFHPFDSKKWGHIYKVSPERHPKLKYGNIHFYVVLTTYLLVSFFLLMVL